MVAPLLRACRLGSCKLTLVRGQLCDDVARAPLIFVRLDPSISTLYDSAFFILTIVIHILWIFLVFFTLIEICQTHIISYLQFGHIF